MQKRGAAAEGKVGESGREFSKLLRQRAGLKVSGSGKKRGSRCMTQVLMKRLGAARTGTSQIVQSTLASRQEHRRAGRAASIR